MRRILVAISLVYMSVAVVVAIHAIFIENDGKQDNDVISQEILHRSVLWPLLLID